MYQQDEDENHIERGKYIVFGRVGSKNGKHVAGGNIIQESCFIPNIEYHQDIQQSSVRVSQDMLKFGELLVPVVDTRKKKNYFQKERSSHPIDQIEKCVQGYDLYITVESISKNCLKNKNNLFICRHVQK